MKTIEEIRHSNLLILLEEFGGPKSLADRLGKSPAQISQWKSKSPDSRTGKPRSINQNSAREIEEKLGRTRGWMDTDHGGQSSNVASAPARPIKAWDDELELGGDYITLPRLTIEGSCGNGSMVWHVEEKGQRQAFRRSWCERLGINPEHAATIVASGDSMNDRIQDGDSLVVDPTQQSVLDGKVYVLTYQSEWFIKRVFKRPGGGLRIVSDNPDKNKYPDWDINPDSAEQLQIIGRVMGISGGI